MPAVDFSSSNAEYEALLAKLQQIVAAHTIAPEVDVAQLQADLAAAQNDIATSQAAEADFAAKLKAANDMLAAILPPAS